MKLRVVFELTFDADLIRKAYHPVIAEEIILILQGQIVPDVSSREMELRRVAWDLIRGPSLHGANIGTYEMKIEEKT